MTCSRVGSRYPIRGGMGGLHCDCCPDDSRKRTGRKAWAQKLGSGALVQQNEVQAAAMKNLAAVGLGGSRFAPTGAMLRLGGVSTGGVRRSQMIPALLGPSHTSAAARMQATAWLAMS